MKVVSYDGHNINDTTNYVAVIYPDGYSLPRVDPVMVRRSGQWPLVASIDRSERVLFIEIEIKGSSVGTLQDQLYQWFDPHDETPKKLIVENDDGSGDRFIYAICESLNPISTAFGFYRLVTLRVHGDPLWRENTASTDTWNITATGQTKAITNSGKAKAFPVLTITPTSAKTGDYTYRLYSNIKWRGDQATRYPVDVVDIYNTAALVTGGKMQADGDDLRVFVDGVEVIRWLDGINTTTTKVWANIDFQATQGFTLVTSIAASGNPATIDLSEDISGLPSDGYVFVSDEVFHYTRKNNANRQLEGITRAQLGSSMVSHPTTHQVLWLQHVIEVFYGNATASTPTVDDTYKPIFNLNTSTNMSWDFDDFGDNTFKRPGAWIYFINGAFGTIYTGNRGANADPWSEVGLYSSGAGSPAFYGRWVLFNPCGFTDANFQNGEKYKTTTGTLWQAGLYSSTGVAWVLEYSIPIPSAAVTWEAWSRNEPLTGLAKYVSMYFEPQDAGDYLEVADVTMSLANYPVVFLSAEIGDYNLNCTITNETTGDQIEIRFNMALNQGLEVDTDDHLITYLLNNSNQLQALTLVDGARRDWLPLNAGSNTIRFDDAGTNGVTIGFSWEERVYQ